MSKFMRYLKLLFVLLLLPVVAWAQPGGAYSGSDYFEGTIEYRFYVGGEQGDLLKNLNPVQFLNFHISENNYIAHLYGRKTDNPMQIAQPFTITRVFIGDSNHTYVVDAPNERYFAEDGYEPDDTIPPGAEPTGDSLLVLNYMCDEYKVYKDNDTITYYVNDDVKINLAYFPDSTNARANFLTYGLSGRIPLMTIRKNAKRTIKIKATNVRRRELDKEQFLIPEGFKRFKKDYRRY